eukprot:TRINITY_DN4177_c0_g1_i1.p1 TRINITY_DN4177_c0_g1~~TRINITY_DN4177_c0_g1_i1.p1  ORF type:complete len:388 (-),score=64.13 TRINITY_DN4177_c0_g1_i1:33-1196(-)
MNELDDIRYYPKSSSCSCKTVLSFLGTSIISAIVAVAALLLTLYFVYDFSIINPQQTTVIYNPTIWDPYLYIDHKTDQIHLFVLEGPYVWYQRSAIVHARISIESFVSSTGNWGDWEMLNTAIGPGSDYRNEGGCWTGSVIEKDGLFSYFYTAAAANYSIAKRQVILQADSVDLNSWETLSTRGIHIDYTIYERYNGSGNAEADLKSGHWYDESWRDPFVFLIDGVYHAFISSRVNLEYFKENYDFPDTNFKRRGCIAHAIYEPQTEQWKVAAPVYMPGVAPELEVPSFYHIGDWYYLVFSAHPHNWVEGPHVGFGGSFYVKSKDPFTFEGYGKALHATRDEKYYSGRLVVLDDYVRFIAHYQTDHRYGGLIEPIIVSIDSEGDLHL